MKALFFDLDSSLITPISGGRVNVSWQPGTSPAEVRRLIQEAETTLPKNTVLISHDTANPSALGLIYRNLFPQNPNDWQFNGHVMQAIKEYVAEGFCLVIITNQGGIEAGFTTAEEVEGKLTAIMDNVSEYYPTLTQSYQYCPSLKEHPDRKPNAGMIYKAQAELGIDLSLSLFVGDMESDRQAAAAAGVSYMDIKDFLRHHGQPNLRNAPGHLAADAPLPS